MSNTSIVQPARFVTETAIAFTGVDGTAQGVSAAAPLPVAGRITADLGSLNGAASDSTLTAIRTAIGAPLQAGGSIGNAAFGISGPLPGFAAPPTVNLGTAPVLSVVQSAPLPAGANAIGTVLVSNLPVTQPISAAALPLPAGAAVEAGGNLAGIRAALGAPVFAATGIAPVTGSITGPAQSGSFVPNAGRDFNVTMLPTGASANSAQVERQFGSAGAWYPIVTDAMRQNLPVSFTLSEPEASVAIRVNVLSGTFTVRISQ